MLCFILKNPFHLFLEDQIVMNMKTEQAAFRCSVRRLNERFPSVELRQTRSNSEEPDGEAASRGLYAAVSAAVDPSLLPHGGGCSC